ncbi:MAG: dihydrodipicolinate reductase [Sphingomonadales bacterium]|nr:dihydrodipicolinate reductase [Sphingomonadales bacterium]
MADRLRVVQWATGTVGGAAMRAILDHPGMELVGARVYSEAKTGRDLGELCGRPPLGVTATRSLADVLALKPDCVSYMPESTDMDDVVALLEAGINVVGTRAEFFNPHGLDGATRARIEAACAKGGSSIHASGSSPGFITEALPIVLLSLVRRLDLLSIDEFANCVDGCSEEMLVEIMGFGETPEVFARRNLAARDEVFEHSLALVADAIGMKLDGFETASEFALCRTETKLHRSTIPAGSVGGQRVTLTGLRGGKPLLRFRSNWFVTTDLEPDWDLRSDGWRVLVEGDTPLDISISFPIPPEQRMATLPNLTAHRPVNAIPAVCAAPPGFVTTTALPQVIARLA